MSNPTQWPSFPNLSVWYAQRVKRQLSDFSVPVILLQRWWRQRGLERKHQKLYPIVIERRVCAVYKCIHNILSKRKTANGDPEVNADLVFFYEKLDGTNLGMRCDGKLFGRRQEISGTSYQRVSLTNGALPDRSMVQNIKERIAEMIHSGEADDLETFNKALPTFLLYGELMCNPGRYNYHERGLANTWLCFGAMFDSTPSLADGQDFGKFDQNADDNIWLKQAKDNAAKLRAVGLLATMSPENGKITLRLNDKLMNIINEVCATVSPTIPGESRLNKHVITCVPFVDKGTLRDVCLRQRERMFHGNRVLEGMVITGQQSLFKWKTGAEDESKGHALLQSIQRDVPLAALQLAGVDIELMDCLLEIAGAKGNSILPRKIQKEPSSAHAKQSAAANACYDDDVLVHALESAYSKYDALEAFFARGERNIIQKTLIKELIVDLVPTTKPETVCIHRFVAKSVGLAFGAWSKQQ